MAQTSGYLSLNAAIVDDPRFLKPLLAQRPAYARLYTELDSLDAWFAFPGPRSEDISQAIMGLMRGILRGRLAPEAALASMVAEAERRLPTIQTVEA